MDVDFQFFVNTVVGIITFFGGWVLKIFWERLKEQDEELNSLRLYHEKDLKESRKDISNLALSLAENYVHKEDFSNLVKPVHHRFDRLEEKIDSLPHK